MKEIKLNAVDNYALNIHIFEVNNPKGYIQVIHGMEEHQERYEPFIEKLNEIGYTVISSNMRGHGDDAPLLGFFKDKDGYKYLLSDQETITKYIMDTYNTKKVIIFAHSMGTIITRNLMQKNSQNYEKVILSGFPKIEPMAGFGLFLANIIKLFKGPRYFAKGIVKTAVGSFNKGIKNPKTPVDWISYNEDNVDKYLLDPYCGHGFKISAFCDLFHLVINMGKPKLYTNVNNELPLLLISGQDDPCTGGVKGVNGSIKVLNKAGFKEIHEISYPKMRHEILNEKNNDKVINDILNFLG